MPWAEVPVLRVSWELRRDAPLDDEERALLREHAARWAEDWRGLEPYGLVLGDDALLARGACRVPDDPRDPDTRQLLAALADLRSVVVDAELVVAPEARVRWHEGPDTYRLRPRRSPVVGPVPSARPAASRVALPPAGFTRDGLDAWRAAVPLTLPLPPGPPAGWTTLLHELGPGVLLTLEEDGATDDLLRDLLQELGRPVFVEESTPLLLVTPIPAGSVRPALARRLACPGARARAAAAACLGALGAAEALPHLLGALDDEDDEVRAAAAEAQGRLGAREAVAALAAGPWDPVDEVVAARLVALDRLGAWEEAAALLPLDDEGPAAALARAVLAAVLEGDVGGLARVLVTDRPAHERVAAHVLSRRPDLARRCVDELLELLASSPEEDVGVLAARALAGVGEEALDPLLDLLDADHWEDRTLAAVALSSEPALAVASEEALRRRLEEETDADALREVRLALAAAGDGDVLDALQPELATTRHAFVRRAAALAPEVPALAVCGVLTGHVAPSLDLLPAVVRSHTPEVLRGGAALLLALAEPARAAPLFDRLAGGEAPDGWLALRRWAAAALLLTGSPPRGLGAVHRILLGHTGETRTPGSVRAPGLAAQAGELAVLATHDPHWPVRLEALRLLDGLGPEALAHHAPLVAWLATHDPDADVRAQAARMAPPPWRAPDAPELLADALAGPPEGRPEALDALAAADPDLAARAAEPLLRDPDPDVAWAAARVLAGDGGDGGGILAAVGWWEE